jgi:subfamily B ATP-binding cassette protein HlyB/CyaB
VKRLSTAEFIAGIDMFSAFDKQALDGLAAQAESRWYDLGEQVCTAGDDCEEVYIIRSGSVRLFSEDNGKELSAGVRKAGEVFGELGALRAHKQEHSVRACGKAELLTLSREVIAPFLAGNDVAANFVSSYVAIRTAGNVVNRLFHLEEKVDPAEFERLVRRVGITRLPKGTSVLEQGSSDDQRLYVVHQGQVKVCCVQEGTEYAVRRLLEGEVFGEHAALKGGEQPVSVIAETDVILLVIPEETLRVALERNPRVKEMLAERVEYAERELRRQKKVAETRGRPTLLDLRSGPRLGERILPRFPLIEQAEASDCGAACLAMICKYHGLRLTLGKLREMANVTTDGATLESLARVGEAVGFGTRGVQATYASLFGFGLPFIAHWEGYHYVVVYGISRRHIWVADPARGFAKMTVDDFEKGWTGTCLLFTPGAGTVELEAARSPWRRFAGYLAPYRNVISHLILATLIIELLGVAPPVIVQNILDRVVVHHSVELLHVVIVGLIIAHVFVQLTTVLRAFLANFLTRNLDFTMISQFFMHTLSLPMSFFNKRRTGDIFARFQENVTVRNFLTESTISTILNVLMTFVYVAVLFMYNVKMTLLLMAFVIPIAVLTVAVTPKIKDYARRAFETSTDAEAVLMETISGAETVKAMGIGRAMRIRWEKRYAKALDVQYRAQRFDILVGAIGQLLNAGTMVVILWVGVNMVLSNELTIGQLIAFNMLMGSVMAPLMGLIGLWDELHETGVAMERLGDVLDIEPEQKPADLDSRILLPELKGQIRFEDVFFRYGGEEAPFVLENISIDIRRGELVAIVGQSGSGKTTLAKLVAGFYPPTEGRVYVDGYDLNVVEKEYYRRQMGYVMQNNLLFSGTVGENIAAGEENPDKRRVVEAARLADAHGFISAMPLGYEQSVGERGMGLSGGQMQRLCIARALYHDPQILVLDEATSALDTQSESNIVRNMQRALGGRTAVVIAHRLSTIMNADKILLLHNGSIVEEGRHEGLVERKGMYYELVRRQMAGIQ